MPWLGIAFGAVAGTLGAALADVGVADKFIQEVGETIEPGHSALFWLVSKPTPDRLEDELKQFHATLLQTSLSREDEARLRAVFGAEEEDV